MTGNRFFAILASGGAAVALATGCANNPFVQQQNWAVGANNAPQNPVVSQLADVNDRVQQLDLNNQDLHTELARSKQQVQILQQEGELLRRQLSDAVAQVEQVKTAGVQAGGDVQGMFASATKRIGAAIAPGANWTEALRTIQIPGVDVRQEGDLLRISVPSDQLFMPGTSQLSPQAGAMMNQVAEAVRREFPRQIVGIEGHLDAETAAPNAAKTQLSTEQATAVFRYLVEQGRLPESQFFVMGQGQNKPLVSNGTLAGRMKNRRIELAVYPEKFN